MPLFTRVATAVAAALFLSAGAASAAPVLTGSWEAAQGADGERLYLVLEDKGRAKIVEEYNFELPGQPGKRHGRSTTFAHWRMKGKDVVLNYAKRDERLRYADALSLDAVGRTGTAPALRVEGTPDAQSRIRSAVLWRAPHDYRRPAPAAAAAASSGAAAPASSPAR